MARSAKQVQDDDWTVTPTFTGAAARRVATRSGTDVLNLIAARMVHGLYLFSLQPWRYEGSWATGDRFVAGIRGKIAPGATFPRQERVLFRALPNAR